jgi:hypothetical protein
MQHPCQYYNPPTLSVATPAKWRRLASTGGHIQHSCLYCHVDPPPTSPPLVLPASPSRAHLNALYLHRPLPRSALTTTVRHVHWSRFAAYIQWFHNLAHHTPDTVLEATPPPHTHTPRPLTRAPTLSVASTSAPALTSCPALEVRALHLPSHPCTPLAVALSNTHSPCLWRPLWPRR